MRRVVVTGVAGFSPIGNDWETIEKNLREGKTGIQYMKDWECYEELNTRLGAPVSDFEKPSHYSRKQVRSMGRVALMATVATERALADAGLLGNAEITDGRMGISYGSSTGSPDAIADFGNMRLNHYSGNLNANSYLKMMSHTAAVNIGVFFSLKGRLIPTSSACTSGSQGIGYAYEAIKYGHQDLMVAGGAEELCGTEAAVFDTLYATSTKNETPELSPRPYDKERDGLVIGEGAGTLILEEREHALNRGATIYAEIVGFGTNSDGSHITQPQPETMYKAMKIALTQSGLQASDIGYVSGHGTATDRGDIAETQATERLLGKVPISTFKSYTGHTLGACGALESIVAIKMMNQGWFHGTANLENIDPECGDLDYLMGEGREIETDVVMSNNFAFGGINTSLIFRKP
ncbi:MAG: beta-ketoacyl-ACP synthase [Porticoccus sp.]|nr:beta-ketoacyl-ACP synthase [Porticoccus sp.]MBQ0806899.1 beta-ketoacyl-ACP synthase [Porticoccus sp.]